MQVVPGWEKREREQPVYADEAKEAAQAQFSEWRAASPYVAYDDEVVYGEDVGQGKYNTMTEKEMQRIYDRHEARLARLASMKDAMPYEIPVRRSSALHHHRAQHKRASLLAQHDQHPARERRQARESVSYADEGGAAEGQEEEEEEDPTNYDVLALANVMGSMKAAEVIHTAVTHASSLQSSSPSPSLSRRPCSSSTGTTRKKKGRTT
jgi:hypothetical protein